MILERPFSEIVIDAGFLSRVEMTSILSSRSDTVEPIGDLLVRLNKISVKQKVRCDAQQMEVPFVDLANLELDVKCAQSIPHAMAVRILAIPIERTELAASVAMVDPHNLAAIDELSAETGLEIDPLLATQEDITEAIFRVFGSYDDLADLVRAAKANSTGIDELSLKDLSVGTAGVLELKDESDAPPIIKLTNAIMSKAISMRASDIHIEPQSGQVRVRLRIDGLLQEIMTVPKDLQQMLASRIKILAGLDIAERRIPQDGRCTLAANGTEYDFRVSTYPSMYGETVVLRILNKQGAMLDLAKLGISKDTLARLIPALEEPQGLILVNGPTGSGKTTTLYSSLNYLNTEHRNIITIEDPVEYQLNGITQAGINPRAGVTFLTGLRSILRQDPDVILVGEVRDLETAGIAIEAALTGHLVLTSLHANDSASALTRLMDMGIEAFLLASSLTASVAQRLVRICCRKCYESYRPEAHVLEKLGLSNSRDYGRGRGCESCAKTGFRGRLGVYEVLTMSSEIRRMILSGSHSSAIREVAHTQGMRTLRDDAIGKVLEGLTTPDEVLRVTADN